MAIFLRNMKDDCDENLSVLNVACHSLLKMCQLKWQLNIFQTLFSQQAPNVLTQVDNLLKSICLCVEFHLLLLFNHVSFPACQMRVAETRGTVQCVFHQSCCVVLCLQLSGTGLRKTSQNGKKGKQSTTATSTSTTATAISKGCPPNPYFLALSILFVSLSPSRIFSQKGK